MRTGGEVKEWTVKIKKMKTLPMCDLRKSQHSTPSSLDEMTLSKAQQSMKETWGKRETERERERNTQEYEYMEG